MPQTLSHSPTSTTPSWVLVAPHDLAHGAWRLTDGTDNAGIRDGPLPEMARRIPLDARANVTVLAPLSRCVVIAVDLPLLPENKLRLALPGALEGHVLNSASAQHYAAGPVQESRLKQAALCDAAWLNTCLEALAHAQLSPRRVVPEAVLLPECSAWWGALEGGASPAWLVRSANGEAARVAAPLLEAVLPDAAASSNPPWQWFADPACPAPVMPVSAAKLAPLSVAALAQRAATSAWDLRQFRYATPDRAARVLAWGTRLMQQRSGRFALAAMVALAAVNIIGLNLYAMKQQRAIAARHDTMEAIVTQALPGAPRILEPAMQLESAWRKTRGAANSASGAAALLEALARTNATTALTTLEVSERQLRARFANADGLKAALAGCAPGAAQPVRCTRDGDQLLIEHVNPPASPAGKTG